MCGQEVHRKSLYFSLNFSVNLKLHFKKKCIQGFPGGAVVENLPANAGNTGSSPGLGRSHIPRSNQAHEPQLLSLHVWSLCSATREAAIVRGLCTVMKSGPRQPQLEKALTQKRRPNTAINKQINNSHKNKKLYLKVYILLEIQPVQQRKMCVVNGEIKLLIIGRFYDCVHGTQKAIIITN